MRRFTETKYWAIVALLAMLLVAPTATAQPDRPSPGLWRAAWTWVLGWLEVGPDWDPNGRAHAGGGWDPNGLDSAGSGWDPDGLPAAGGDWEPNGTPKEGPDWDPNGWATPVPPGGFSTEGGGWDPNG